MNRIRQDRFVAIGAVALIALIALLIVQTVLDAQRRGRNALERNQEATIAQLAASMESRISSALDSLSGLALGPYTFDIGSDADRARLQILQDLNPQARTGMILVNPDGVVTMGTLLVDETVIGQPLERPGLNEMLAQEEAVILPVSDGLTTSLPTYAIAYPVLDDDGSVLGGFVFEGVVAADSDFNKEIVALEQGETGRFSFVDERGTVIASTDPSLLAGPLAADLRSGPAGLTRIGDLVIGREDVPSAGWRLIFTQDVDEFEAGLGRRVQLALLLTVLAALLGGGLAFVAVLRRLRAERAERQRMEEINKTREEFISIVSHELRTPVAGIAGFLDTTIDHWHTMTDEAKHRAVTRARANARRLQALTRDVLDSRSLETGQLSYAFDVIDLSAELAEGVTAALEVQPDREITFERPPHPTWVLADPDRIQQVLINLLDNATRNSPRGTAIEIRLETDEHTAQVSVRDHGPGIADADREKLFDKWVRGQTAVQGTGLGLYVSRLIVEAHHGTIEAHRASGGGGEEFTFAIPLTTAPAGTTITV